MGAQVSDAEHAALLAAAQAMMAISLKATNAGERISAPQLRTLSVLDHVGQANLGMLAEALGVANSTMSRLCDRLVANGLIDRRPSERTRREVELTLTADGKQLLTELNQRRLDYLTSALDTLPAADRSQVIAALGQFASAMGFPNPGIRADLADELLVGRLLLSLQDAEPERAVDVFERFLRQHEPVTEVAVYPYDSDRRVPRRRDTDEIALAGPAFAGQVPVADPPTGVWLPLSAHGTRLGQVMITPTSTAEPRACQTRWARYANTLALALAVTRFD